MSEDLASNLPTALHDALTEHILGEQSEEVSRRRLDKLSHFLDTHDEPRFARACAGHQGRVHQALAFTMLKDWDQRDGATAQGEVAAAAHKQVATSAAGRKAAAEIAPPSAVHSPAAKAAYAPRVQSK